MFTRENANVNTYDIVLSDCNDKLVLVLYLKEFCITYKISTLNGNSIDNTANRLKLESEMKVKYSTKTRRLFERFQYQHIITHDDIPKKFVPYLEFCRETIKAIDIDNLIIQKTMIGERDQIRWDNIGMVEIKDRHSKFMKDIKYKVLELPESKVKVREENYKYHSGLIYELLSTARYVLGYKVEKSEGSYIFAIPNKIEFGFNICFTTTKTGVLLDVNLKYDYYNSKSNYFREKLNKIYGLQNRIEAFIEEMTKRSDMIRGV